MQNRGLYHQEDAMNVLSYMLLLIGLVAYDAAIAATVTLPEADLTFTAPAGFSPLTKNEIALVYQTRRPPKFAVGNAERTTTIAYDLYDTAIRVDQLKEAKPAIEAQLAQTGSRFTWKRRDLITLEGQKWISFEYTFHGSDGEGGDVEFHDIIMMTSRHNRLLRLSFNSTQEEFPAVEKALRKTIQSITFTAK